MGLATHILGWISPPPLRVNTPIFCKLAGVSVSWEQGCSDRGLCPLSWVSNRRGGCCGLLGTG